MRFCLKTKKNKRKSIKRRESENNNNIDRIEKEKNLVLEKR